MTPQKNIEADEDYFAENEDYFDEEYFKDWLEALQVMLETQIFMDLPEKRRQELTAYILLRRPAQTVAQELVKEMPDSLIEELSDKPLESLLDELAQRLSNYLLSSMIRTMTDWLKEGMWKAATKGSGPSPKHSPNDMALHLVRIMMDKSSDGIFCPPEAATTIRFGKAARSPYSTRQYFQYHCAPCGFSFDQPGFLALLTRANAVRFGIAGMAAIMLFARIHNGKTIDKHSLFGQS